MNKNTKSVCLGILPAVFLLARAAAAAPFFVDLSGVANVAREDDGIAGNGKGGWADEGINDMYVHPAVPVGEQFVNGFHFSLIDPAKSGGRDVVMLQSAPGADTLELPTGVDIPVPSKTAKFLYFVQNAVRDHAPAGTVAAVYTLAYADGTAAELPQRFGQELFAWWCKNWWDNGESLAWPVHMARNTYSMKYNFHIGLWATRVENPHPDKPIVSIRFASALAKVGPVLWAVTLDDEDYWTTKEAREKEVWGRPADAPEGYFDVKTAQEAARKYKAAQEAGFAHGIVALDVVRPDLLAVTVDAAFVHDTHPPKAKLEARLAAHPFSVASKDDPAYASPVAIQDVARFTFEEWNGPIGDFNQETVYRHTLYLRLPAPLQEGKSYTVAAACDDAADAPLFTRTLDFTDRRETPVIKVNQAAYLPQSAQRYAYLGWWAGEFGAVDYAGFTAFEVLSEADGAVALQGEIKPRALDDKASGENVYEMDLSALRPGRYVLRVPGLGTSSPFAVGGDAFRDLYARTQRVFFHQRCGQELKKPFADFERPACHLWVDKDGHIRPAPKVGEDKLALQCHVGGYHDAGDDDCFTYHLRATQQNLDAFEMFPGAFRDGDLNLPESGNGIPDLLDEARWALLWYRDHQEADGGVPKGRCNDADSRRQNHLKWGDYGIFRPDRLSNFEYAAVATSFARLWEPHDNAEAAKFLDSAKKAYAWSRAQEGEMNRDEVLFGVWAASELYIATKEAAYQDDIRAMGVSVDDKNRIQIKFRGDDIWSSMALWHYATYDFEAAGLPVDADLRKKFRDLVLMKADRAFADKTVYRCPGAVDGRFYWGGGNGGGYYAEVLLRAWKLTGEAKYLDAASLCADFQLGCNAISRTFMTGTGSRPARHPQLSPALYEKPGKLGSPLAGVVVFGICSNRVGPEWYPEIPEMRRYRDIGGGGAEYCSEFTITETTGCNAMLYAVFHALAEQGEAR